MERCKRRAPGEQQDMADLGDNGVRNDPRHPTKEQTIQAGPRWEGHCLESQQGVQTCEGLKQTGWGCGEMLVRSCEHPPFQGRGRHLWVLPV